MTSLPTGTVSFLFTDVDGSTRLLRVLGERYDAVFEAQRAILSEAVAAHGGVVFGTEGDAVFAVFASAPDAVDAAAAAQRALLAHPWPEDGRVLVRIAVHTGEARVVGGDYVGLALHVAARVCAAGHGGQVLVTDAARAAVTSCEARDLGEHRLKDLAEPVRLHQLTGDGLAERFPPLRSFTSMPNNLPVPADEFVGRARERRELLEGLRSHRLVTITGAGGSGKSRLAIEVAASVLPTVRDGAWLVELASSSDGSRIAVLVASVLGLGERAGQPIEETLVEWLRGHEVLLVLDNCEHLVDDVAAFVERLVHACPALRVVATSREHLGVRGELGYRLRPLEVESDAVALFLARGRAAVAGFAPEGEDLATVVQVCRRLDGLPLAIELAAARLRALSLDQLASRLDDRFRLLTGGSRTDLARQRTLEAVVAWSYDLLGDAERRRFRAVSVFPDSFTLDAAAAVAGGETLEVLDAIERLLEKSLLVPVEGRTGTDRYQLLETLRQYGRERLVEHGEAVECRDALLAWALTQVERLEADMRTPRQDASLLAAVADRENLRAAMEWARERDDLVSALRLVSAVPIGLTSERRALIADLCARVSDAVPTTVLAQAHLTLANLAFEQGDWQATVDAATIATARFDAAGDRRHAAWGRMFLVTGRWGAGNLAGIEAVVAHALDAFRALDDPLGIAYMLWAGSGLASDRDTATAMATEADRRFRELGSPMGLAHAVEGRAILALDAGEMASAAPFLREAVELFSSHGNHGCTAHALEAAAVWATSIGDREVAAELVGAADALRAVSGRGHAPWEIRNRRGHGGIDDLAEGAALGDAVARGRAHSLESAATFALGALSAPVAAGVRFGT